jgi:C1A family cysteine protease
VGCTSNVSRQYYVVNWSYVTDQPDAAATPNWVPSDAAIKSAITTYGPLAASVISEGWDAYTKYDASGNLIPNWDRNYPRDVFPGVSTPNCDKSKIDHEICIVGWDDDDDAWIVKNSWGPYWGLDGYIKVKYGTNYIGFGASWVMTPSASAPYADVMRVLQLK